MSIFSNFKINSLRRKVIEGNYERRLEKMSVSLSALPLDQRLELAVKVGFAIQANVFAKSLIFLLFHPDTGVFRDDTGNLNELNFDKLYEVIVAWYSWVSFPNNPESARNSLETGLGLSPLVIKIYHDSLTGETYSVNFFLYRWCMLAVGHVDSYYETMHENSPDCKRFIEILEPALTEAEKFWDKK